MEMSAEKVLGMYRTMVLIREFEERAEALFLGGEVPGFMHMYIGEEAVATGVMAALRTDDLITSTHRGHGHLIAKGGDVKLMMAEILGKSTGYCKGKGGSMHIAEPDLGILGANGIVGAGMPIAAGAAFGCKYLKSDRVSVAMFGDGASNRGTFHESLNLAAVLCLPAIFVCENNGFGEGTRQCFHQKITDVSVRAAGYDVPGRTVDGNDVIAVYEAMDEFVTRARNGDGPALLELKTWRYRGHYVGDAEYYREASETVPWIEERDPINRCAELLLTKKWATQADLDRIGAGVKTEVEEAIDFARKSPFPGPEELMTDVLAD